MPSRPLSGELCLPTHRPCGNFPPVVILPYGLETGPRGSKIHVRGEGPDQITQVSFFYCWWFIFFGNQTKPLCSVQEWGAYYTHDHAQAAGERQRTGSHSPVFNPSTELKCLKPS